MTIPNVTDQGFGPQTADASPDPYPTIPAMRATRRWLLANPNKVPHYITGQRRSGALDAPADLAQLASYDEARAVLARCEDGWHLGFALGPDGNGGCWQGIDLDKIVANQLADFANTAPGYIEMSPSGAGAHALGYGRQFSTLGSNGSGIEAYAGARYFTVTERPIRDCGLVCLAGYVEQRLAPRHGAARPASPRSGTVEIISVDPTTVTELRSALLHMRSDDRVLWVAVGQALAELGDTGRGLWMEWSSTSDKFDANDAARKWDGFDGARTGYQAVFKKAQDAGWTNPASAAAKPTGSSAEQSDFHASDNALKLTLEFAMSSDTATLTLEYLLDPWLPLRCVVGFFGRGSTAKSSFLASTAAFVSSQANNPGSTLWVSVEEPDDWIKVRHIACGGADKTLAVVKAIESKRDKQGRVVASSFNVHEHLEPAIVQAKEAFAREQRPPLRLVVLDTAVGLTTWGKGESPNDDAAVKKLLAHLQASAEKHNLTIAIIGHANKGTHDHLADTVMGATAWTNSPRLSFIHAEDRREDYTYVVRVAKSNLVTFGAPYRTEPVYTLHQRANGPDSVLVKVVPGEIVWGSLDSMEMFRDATKKPRDDDEGDGDGPPPRAQTLPESVVQTLVEMTLALESTLQFVTREQVEERMQKKVDRGRWLKIEEHLHNHPQVIVLRGDKNKAEYRRRL